MNTCVHYMFSIYQLLFEINCDVDVFLCVNIAYCLEYKNADNIWMNVYSIRFFFGTRGSKTSTFQSIWKGLLNRLLEPFDPFIDLYLEPYHSYLFKYNI